MRFVALFAAALVALVCLAAGTVSVLSASAVASDELSVTRDGTVPEWTLQRDQLEGDPGTLHLQLYLVPHDVRWARGWAVAAVLAMVVAGLWLLLSSIGSHMRR